MPNVFFSLDDEVLDGDRKYCVADLKINVLSELIVNGDTKIDGSDFLFDSEPLKARLRANALDYSGNKFIKYGEVFRGRISI